MRFGFWKWKNKKDTDKTNEKTTLVGDVFFDPKRRLLDLQKHYFVIKIDKVRLNNFFATHKKTLISLLILLVPISLIIYSSAGFASVANFYATKCLGGWENPSMAEGAPSLDDNADIEDFNNANSAKMRSGSPIYCGGFIGEIPDGSKPVALKVSLAWSVDDGSITHVEPDPFETNPPVQTENQNQDTEINTEINTDASAETNTDTSDMTLGEKLEALINDVKESLNPETIPEPEVTPEIILEPVITTETVPEVTPAPVPETEKAPESEPVTQNIVRKAFSNLFFEKAIAQEEVVTEDVATEEKVITEESKTEEVLPGIIQTTTMEELLIKGAQSSDFLEVKYTLDGENWESLGFVARDNWQKVEFEIPLYAWPNIDNLQISLNTIQTFDELPAVYLDSMVVNVEYEKINSNAELPKILLKDSSIIMEGDDGFSLSANPSFSIIDPNLSGIEINKLVEEGKAEIISDPEGILGVPVIEPVETVEPEPNSTSPDDKNTGSFIDSIESAIENLTEILTPREPEVVEEVVSFFMPQRAGAADLPAPDLSVEILDANGNVTDVPVNVVKFTNQNGDIEQKIDIKKPKYQFSPGRYTLRVSVKTENAIFVSEQDFTWGVLAVNTNKSIYSTGDKAYIQMGVLDDAGHTVCNSDLDMEITSPSGVVSKFSTSPTSSNTSPQPSPDGGEGVATGETGTITRDKLCAKDNVIDVPDYYAYYDVPNEEGTYVMKLTANNKNGIKTVHDSFVVKNDVPFVVERKSATRIYPGAAYPVEIKITANQDWSGTVVDTVPASFEISETGGEIAAYDSVKIHESVFGISDADGGQSIIWNLDLKKGETVTIGYTYDAPDISPEFYLVGPLTFGESKALPEFKEVRRWQIASDGFSYKTVITVDHTKVPNTNQTNFPMLISGTYDGTGGEPDLRTVANGGKVQNASGYDIGFYTNSNCLAGKLAWETEKYTATTGEVVYWVKIPTLTTATDYVFYLCYGTSGFTTDQSDRTNVWDTSYKGVWHLADSTAISAVDSTGNNSTGTITGAVLTTGKIGGGASFDGINDKIDLGNGSSLNVTTPWTIQTWYYSNSSDANGGVLSKNDYNSVWDWCSGTGTGNFRSVTVGQTDNAYTLDSSDKWASAAIVLGGGAFKTYGNGAQLTTRATSATMSTTSNTMAIGRSIQDCGWFKGYADEVRISNTNRSADWLATEYNNQSSPSTFYTMGTPIPVYSYNRAITIDYTKVSTTNHTDFPVLISGTYSYLATVANGGKVTDAQGDDVAFFSDSALTTQLKHEVEKYTATTGEVVYWVKIPTLSYTANTVIYMAYGNSSVTTTQADPTNVWDSNYKNVYHLPDGSSLASPTQDSTTSNKDGTLSGTTIPNAVTGKIGGGANFDGSTGYIDASTEVTAYDASDFTASVWFKKDVSAAFGDIIGWGTGDITPWTYWRIQTRDDNTLMFQAYNGGNASIQTTATGGGTTWNYAVVTHKVSDNSSILYLNGTTDVNGTVSTGDRADYGFNLFGYKIWDSNGGAFFDGVLDEIHISSTLRSAGWILTEYNNQSSPSTFYSVASEVGSISIAGTSNGTGTVKVAVNGTVQAQSTTISGSAWTISDVVQPFENDIITVWIDGGANDAAESTAVTKYSSGNISGMVLNLGVLSIGSNQNTSVSTTNLDQYDCGADEDVMHLVTSGALGVEGLSSCAGSVSNSYSGETLSILASNTLTVASASTETITTELLNNAGTITATGTPTFTLAGTSGTLFTNSGTFTQATSTVTLSGNGDATINSAALTLYNLTVSGTGVKSTHASSAITFATSGTLTVSAGTFDPVVALVASGTNTLTVGTSSGTIRVNASTFAGSYPSGFATKNFNTGSTVDYYLSGTQTVLNTTYYNLTVSTGGTKTLGGDTTVSNVMTIGSGATLSASSYTITLSGTTGTPFVKTGTFTPGTGTVSYTGNNAGGNTSIVPTTYTNLVLNNSSETYVLAGYSYKKSLTIDNAMVANSNQTDFPVLVSLTSDADLAAHAQADGDDIIFTDANGVILAHEIEIYTTGTGELKAWVKIPTLSYTADTIIYMHYGNATVSSQQNPTGVWDSSFKMVQHLPNGTTLTALDSTSNNNDGTLINTPTAGTGKIDGGGNFAAASSERINLPDINASEGINTLTVSGWKKRSTASTVGGAGMSIITKMDIGFTNSWLLYDRASITRSEFAVYIGGTSYKGYANVESYDTNWHYLVGRYDGATVNLYIDGVKQTAETSITGNIDSSTSIVRIATYQNSNDYFDGSLDELRISNVARSADWITTEYRNQGSPATYQTLGSEVATGLGLTATGNLTITAGTLDTVTGSNYDINVGGNWTNYGTFTARSGTVTLNSATTATVAGTTTFYNLTITHTTAKEVDFSLTSGPFSYYRAITIDKTKVPNTDRTDFPVLVSGIYDGTGGEPDLRVTGSGGKVTNSSGYDIGFYSDSALTTKLKWEKEKYVSTTGEIAYWVKVPTVSTSVDTVIYMAYGASSITTDQSDAVNVWDANYTVVYHLPNGSSLGALDSKGVYNGTITGATATTGVIDGGASFDGNDKINTSATQTANTFTFGAWIKTSATHEIDTESTSGLAGFSGQKYAFYPQNMSSNSGAGISVGTNGISVVEHGGSYLPATSVYSASIGSGWNHIVIVFTSKTPVTYLNGTAVHTGLTSPKTNVYSPKNFGWMDYGYFVGQMDEVRVSSSARSADWITTEYNNQNSPSTFYTIGSELTPDNMIIHVTNTFTATGTSGNLMKLYSSSAGNKWHFHPTGTASVAYADVKDGGCESGAITMAPTNTTDSGNNESCWGLAVAPTISFALSANSIALGTMSTSVARFGSHTISAASNATSGFSISYKGLSLTSGANSIPVYTAGASSPGTAGFGINLVDNGNPDVGATVTTNSGTCGIASGYGTVNSYSFVSNTTTLITSISAAADCVYTTSYVGNISTVTPAGSYSTDITYIMTGTF